MAGQPAQQASVQRHHCCCFQGHDGDPGQILVYFVPGNTLPVPDFGLSPGATHEISLACRALTYDDAPSRLRGRGMSIEKLGQYLGAVEDPRCSGKVEHRLVEVLVIAVCAVIACAESWDDIAPCMAAASSYGSGRSWSWQTASRRTTRSVACLC